ncbi:MAG: hypothetical protein KJ884_15795 [Gammaproteobacteria bacterium]|nr:hypothetical protein [Gammaproteobacteria bacterium]MBU1489166.1 hypothetical protein [Gammaproteobacteria bacterium]MBU2065279.1 hypothetical protein [Gammaproteobacteria bacterium]MBU2139407.1 hypothetical protein [Gammaproteobacteria bacterium]MBU2218595.1 hypothetical protein [Gammaproteobacteria bacterium]
MRDTLSKARNALVFTCSDSTPLADSFRAWKERGRHGCTKMWKSREYRVGFGGDGK